MMTPSKPSGPPNPPSDPEPSTTSWTIPEPGDVISYSYLWAREKAEGRDEGVEDRPAVVVLAQIIQDGLTRLLVAPVTHSPPHDPADAIEIPPKVKAYLGLDDERSWIVVTELNRFTWPGPDIRPAKRKDTPLYGPIPAKLFRRIRQAISDGVEAGRLNISSRTE